MMDKLRFPVRQALPMLAGAACVLSSALPALAQTTVDCSTLPGVVYVGGSTAVKPFLTEVAKHLVQGTPPITVVYQSLGSCTGVQNMMTSPATALNGNGIYWDSTGAADLTCSLPIDGSANTDIGVSDVWAETCSQTRPAGIVDFYGPVQSMTFAVPKSSSQHSISAEAAYVVFGFPDGSPSISPWTVTARKEARATSSGTLQMISAALKQVNSSFSASKFQGNANSGAGVVVTNLAASATAGNADSAIGILATDQIDSNRGSVRALALQFKDQACGYTPDSTESSYDKANVRDGHYMIWGPLHMLVQSTDGKKADKVNVDTVVKYLTGETLPTGWDLIAVEAQKGVVPDCAMRVTRSTEVGPLASYMPKHSCECKYLDATTGNSGCQKCTDANGTVSASCTDPTKKVCNYGFCEVQ